MEENPIVLECTITEENPCLPEMFTDTLGEYVYFDPHKDPMMLRTEEEHKQLLVTLKKIPEKGRLFARYFLATVYHLPVADIGRVILQRNHWKRAVLEIIKDTHLSQYRIIVTEFSE